MIRSRTPSFGKEAFLSGRGERIGVTPLRRCVRCRTPNDTRTTVFAETGDGLGPAIDVSVNGVVQSNVKDHVVQSGCKFCGSHKWQHTKPVALPDDRNMPSDDYRRRRRKGR